MKKIENECVDCGLPCMGDSCPYKNVERHYCDDCGDDGDIYEFEGMELCIYCIKKRLVQIC